MTDRRDAPPEWPAPRSGWEPGRHGHTEPSPGYTGTGYAYSPGPAAYSSPPPAYPARHTPAPHTPQQTTPYAPAPQAPAPHAPARHASPGHQSSARPHTRARTRVRRADANRWHWLLLVPIVLPLIPAIYNRIEPTLFGIPFFFWGQLAFAFLASAVITVVHLMVR